MINKTPTDTTNEVEEVFEEMGVENIKQKTISGAASYFLRSILLFGVSIVASGILALQLKVEEFAIFNLVSQITGILVFFSDIGLASALIQQKKEPHLDEYRTVFTIQQLLSWVIFGITVMVAVSGVLQPKVGIEGVFVLLALGFAFPLASLKTIPSIMLERKLQFSHIVIPHIVEQVVYNALLIFFAMSGLGVRSFTYAILARSVVGVLTMYTLKRWPVGFAWDKQSIRFLLSNGSKFQLNDLLARVKDQLFSLVLGLRLPLTEFGYISFAQLYSQVPYTLTVQNVIAITFPTYSRLQHDKALLKRAIEKTLFFISLCIFPLLIGMCVFVRPFIELIPRYQKWEPALFTFMLYTLSIGWSAISTPLTNTLNAIGKINTVLKLMVMWLVLTWIIIPLCIRYFGYEGAGIGTMLISFTSILPIYFVKKIVDVNIWDNIWRQLVAAGVMAAFGFWLNPVWSRSFTWFFVGGALTVGVYGVTLVLLGRKKVVQEVLSLKKK